ncbi:MAG: alanine racemase, partial [Verrucomicrobiaceae bacterium]|nr:alanine racemase [Verrucomicrobiaceae bacterium]
MGLAPSTAQQLFRTWIEIDRPALRHNASVAREFAGEGNQVMAVVKANGYGLGAVDCARALEPDVDAFGVATLGEAIELREAGLHGPIHLLSPLLASEMPAAVERGFIAAVSTFDEAQALSAAARATGKTAVIQFVIDTGMGRIGAIEAQ